MTEPRPAKVASTRIDELIEYRGLTTQEVADYTGLSYTTVLAYRRDTGTRFDRKALEVIAECLEVEVADLFDNGYTRLMLAHVAQAVFEGSPVMAIPQGAVPQTTAEVKEVLSEILRALDVSVEVPA